MQVSKWVALGVAAFCLVAVGGVVGLAHLYLMAAMLITLPAVSYFLGWYTLRGLQFEREAPTPVWEGEETSITYKITNPSRIARFFVSIEEIHDPDVESISMNPSLFNIKGGATEEVKNTVRFKRRGVFESGSFEVSALDPLGVFSFTRNIASETETVVYPMARQLGQTLSNGSISLGWNEATKNARAGDGVDTFGVRGYLPGDPLRHIHWRQTARTGTLTVVEYEETQAVNLRIVLDTTKSAIVGQHADTSLEYAIRVAATIARDAVQSGAGIELVTADTSSSGTIAGWNGLIGQRGIGQLYKIMDALARVEAQSKVSAGQLLESCVNSVPLGTTVIVICLQYEPSLSDVIVNCLARGIAINVLYIDPSGFPGEKFTNYSLETRAKFANLGSLGVAVISVSWNPVGNLQTTLVDKLADHSGGINV